MAAWSYSSLTAFETCPKRFYITRVAKLVREGETEATRWGNQVHKALEYRIRDGTPLPPIMATYEPIAARVSSMDGKVLTETEIALTSGFKETGWFASDAWVRGILDLTVVKDDRALILDWKTGKRKTASDQLRLFAALALAKYEHVDKVSTGFVWLKEKKTDKEHFSRDDVPGIWEEFSCRVRRLELAYENDNWPPKPSGLCRSWCPVGRSNCEFCGK